MNGLAFDSIEPLVALACFSTINSSPPLLHAVRRIAVLAHTQLQPTHAHCAFYHSPIRPTGYGHLLQPPHPLRSVKRNSEDFHIRADEPHRTYSAGDHVQGAVILVVTKPFRITHLVVALHGFVRVWKGPSALDDRPIPSGTSRDQLPPKGYASLFQDEQVLSGDGRLDVGRYEFKFDLVFPTKSDLPSSIDVRAYHLGLPFSSPPPRAPTPPNSNPHRPSSDVESVVPSILSEEPVQEPLPISQQTSTELADTRSVVSGESNFTGSTGLSLPAAEVLSQTSTPAIARSASVAKLQAVDAKTITTTIELLRAGCLPGDTIPVRTVVPLIIDPHQFQSSEAAPTRFGVLGAGATNETNTSYTSWSTNIINTEHLRREKGVISDGLEIIVGTLDTARPARRQSSHGEGEGTVRRAEASPERPTGGTRGVRVCPSPAAPSAPLDDNIYDADDLPGPSAPPLSAFDDPDGVQSPSAPTFDNPHFAIAGPSQPGEPNHTETRTDKQEMERQRLLNEASAPPDFPDDCEPSGSGLATAPAVAEDEPTAPVFSDEDEYGPHFSYSNEVAHPNRQHNHAEPLPKYER
ncbi:unnamed protein product [Parascedosporium putredinis]|uniref:Arrestin-like N-terminal domain-containing protein n=1 Tax=Parascedosporium putredinis TaxID=1442378 RepID=A0A9P1H6T4_9PEZI|nr:unnamed protein product [Parascedosporium putredinis]CAI7997979.1 unnamed protein product [Parascedosporium putredinis]